MHQFEEEAAIESVTLEEVQQAAASVFLQAQQFTATVGLSAQITHSWMLESRIVGSALGKSPKMRPHAGIPRVGFKNLSLIRCTGIFLFGEFEHQQITQLDPPELHTLAHRPNYACRLGP